MARLSGNVPRAANAAEPAAGARAAASARRALLRAAALGAATAALGACGFRPRGAPDFTFRSLWLDMPATPLATELHRQLAGTGRVQVLARAAASPVAAGDAPVRAATADALAQADVRLQSAGESRERIVLSQTASGEVREYQLRVSLRFRLLARDGRELLPESEITRQIDQSYSEAAALSKEAEAQMLLQSLQADIVQQVMRQLATVRP